MPTRPETSLPERPLLLIVDDDALICDTLSFSMRPLFEVVTSHSRPHCMQLLRELRRPPALALVDGSRVLVVKEGKAAAVSVTVSEQDADSVLVSGLSGGEQVISTRSPELHEGTLVEVGSAH